MDDRNPYADNSGYDELAGPERTSALAVLSLILSIACCIPGLGLLGAGLGIGAMIGIGGSRGRVGGKGLAIAGIIVGILVSVAWIGGYFAFKATVDQLLTRSGAIVESLDTGDYAGFRSMTLSPAADLSDADYDMFVEDYRAQLGSYVGMPSDLFEYFENFGDPAIGSAMQNPAVPPGAPPATVYFDNGVTVVFLVPGMGTGDPSTPGDLLYVLPDGSTLMLSDYLGAGGGADATGDGDADDTSEGESEGEPEDGADGSDGP